jgi:adenosylcobyric acid synthase
MSLQGALMVCGATSDAGKSTIVAGLCRLLARQGVKVAPFKAQNMSLNSAVTPDGHEIARAQAFQAFAAGVDADVAMNPVLLKPTTDSVCQVVVHGRPWRVLTAAEYHAAKLALLPEVLEALRTLRARYDVVLCEGAGSPAEINLLDADIANLRVAAQAHMPAVVVGDINPGGVFAALYGTVALLPERLRRHVRGFIVNKLRGDPALLGDACDQLTCMTGIPVLGVVPWLDGIEVDTEDSMALARACRGVRPAQGDEIDIAVVRFPRISNFTDLDPLRVEAGVRIRWVHDRAGLGNPDLVILPGSKAVVSDLMWLRGSGLAEVITRSDTTVLGICGGYQMMGDHIHDTVESQAENHAHLWPGLGLLPVTTRFEATKITRQCTGTAAGFAVAGYQIHHGRVRPHGGDPFVEIDGRGVDGVHAGTRFGTTVHGLFEADEFRRHFLAEAAGRRGKTWKSDGASFVAHRRGAVKRLADAMAAHLDMVAIERLVTEAGA